MSVTSSIAARYLALRPVLYWGATIFGAVYVAASILGLTSIGGCVGGPIIACDAAAYWYLPPNLYEGQTVAGVPPYLYSPAFAWATEPLRWLSFDAFVWVWAGLHVAALLWLRAGWLLAVPGVNEDVIRGNVNVFIAVAVVLALRYPAAWAFPLLTKVAPGIGLIWHLVRREWRALGIALGVTVLIAGIGTLVAHDLWLAWVGVVGGAPNEYVLRDQFIPLPIRAVAAVAIAGYAAHTSRAWLLPVAIFIGWPGWAPPALMVLAAIPRLRRRETLGTNQDRGHST